MWECNFSNEPADHKLFWLLFLKKMKWVLICSFLGALFMSAIYYLHRTVFAPPDEYQVQGEVYVDYVVVEGYGISLTSYNTETWNTMVQSDEFVDRIQTSVTGQGFSINRELLKESMYVKLVSDSRLLITTVTMKDPDLAVAVSHGLLQAIITFGEGQDNVKEIRIMSNPSEAAFVVQENRIFSRALTGAILGAFLSIVVCSLYIAMDDSVYIPSSFEKRYHIPALGTLSSKSLYMDLTYLLKDLNKVAVLALCKNIPIEEVTDQLSSLYDKGSERKQMPAFTPVLDVEEHPHMTETLRKAEGVILVAGFGRHDGKRIERTIAYLKRQDCNIIGALLWEADEKLLLRYYGSKKPNRKGNQS